MEEDHRELEAFIGNWTLLRADGLPQALKLLKDNEVAVVLYENDSKPGTWIDLLQFITQQTHPPYFIVTSRVADERLWAEVLNLGAYDLLAKPFARTEVVQVIASAWLHWHDEVQKPVTSMKIMKAAS